MQAVHTISSIIFIYALKAAKQLHVRNRRKIYATVEIHLNTLSHAYWDFPPRHLLSQIPIHDIF